MVFIHGQEWQDFEAYQMFMSQQEKHYSTSSKNDMFEEDLELLVKAVQDRQDYFEMPLRAGQNFIVYPGEAILMFTGITSALLDDYMHAIELSNVLEVNSWLRVAPFLINKTGLSYLDLRNYAQYELARRESLSTHPKYTLPDNSNGIYMQNLENIDENNRLHHVAYNIQTGDEIATLKIRKRQI